MPRSASLYALIPVLLAALFLYACGGGGAKATSTPSPIPTPTVEPTPSPTPTPTPPPPPPPAYITPIEGESGITEQLSAIAAIVSGGRELMPTEPVEVGFMTRAELASFLRSKLEEDRDDITKSEELYKVLGLLKEDEGLFPIYLRTLSSDVLGLYDSRARKMFVVKDVEELGSIEQITFVHEYVHALQQQHFDIRSLREGVKGRNDRVGAVSALVEGDASFLEFDYLVNFFTQAQINDFLAQERPSALEKAPPIVLETIIFPYREGAAFVAAILSVGGWELVNSMFDTPPVSTEQVMHPEKYLDFELPADPFLPDMASALGPAWSQVDRDSLGEFLIKVYLSQFTFPTLAEGAAAGWGGDKYLLFKSTRGQRLFVWLTNWDSLQDSTEFFDAYKPLASNENVYLSRQSLQVLVIIAPDAPTIDLVVPFFKGF